jgi:hypothetical protein
MAEHHYFVWSALTRQNLSLNLFLGVLLPAVLLPGVPQVPKGAGNAAGV